ncbi:MAG: hypothetical protein SGARI_000873 [Bacillariaceae sp.]
MTLGDWQGEEDLELVPVRNPYTLEKDFGDISDIAASLASGPGKGKLMIAYGTGVSVGRPVESGHVKAEAVPDEVLNVIAMPGTSPPCCMRLKNSSDKQDRDNTEVFVSIDKMKLRWDDVSTPSLQEKGSRFMILTHAEDEEAGVKKREEIKKRLGFSADIMTQCDLIIPGHNEQWKVQDGDLRLSVMEYATMVGPTPSTFDFNADRAAEDNGYVLKQNVLEELLEDAEVEFEDAHDQEPGDAEKAEMKKRLKAQCYSEIDTVLPGMIKARKSVIEEVEAKLDGCSFASCAEATLTRIFPRDFSGRVDPNTVHQKTGLTPPTKNYIDLREQGPLEIRRIRTENTVTMFNAVTSCTWRCPRCPLDAEGGIFSKLEDTTCRKVREGKCNVTNVWLCQECKTQGRLLVGQKQDTQVCSQCGTARPVSAVGSGGDGSPPKTPSGTQSIVTSFSTAATPSAATPSTLGSASVLLSPVKGGGFVTTPTGSKCSPTMQLSPLIKPKAAEDKVLIKFTFKDSADKEHKVVAGHYIVKDAKTKVERPCKNCSVYGGIHECRTHKKFNPSYQAALQTHGLTHEQVFRKLDQARLRAIVDLSGKIKDAEV